MSMRENMGITWLNPEMHCSALHSPDLPPNIEGRAGLRVLSHAKNCFGGLIMLSYANKTMLKRQRNGGDSHGNT